MREKRRLPDWAEGESVHFDRIEIQHATQVHTGYMLINACHGLFTDEIFDSFHDAYAELKRMEGSNGDPVDVDEQIVRVAISIIPDEGHFRPSDFNERGRHKWGDDSR